MISRGLQEFVNTAQLKPLVKSVRTQMLEIKGAQEFDKGLYHNKQYEELVKQLNSTRTQYRQELQLEQRKQIAKSELNLWQNYVEQRKQNTSEDFKLNEKITNNLKQIWAVVRDRHESTLKSSKMLEFHQEYSKAFKFEVPLEAKCLAQLVHPHLGYLSHFNKNLTFEDLIQIYEYKLVSSYEKYLGQTLLGEEISALTYWTQFDTNGQGYMDIPTFVEFLQVFKFSLNPNLQSVKNEFSFALKQFPGEFHRDIDQNDMMVRYDLFRYIFLERNL